MSFVDNLAQHAATVSQITRSLRAGDVMSIAGLCRAVRSTVMEPLPSWMVRREFPLPPGRLKVPNIIIKPSAYVAPESTNLLNLIHIPTVSRLDLSGDPADLHDVLVALASLARTAEWRVAHVSIIEDLTSRETAGDYDSSRSDSSRPSVRGREFALKWRKALSECMKSLSCSSTTHLYLELQHPLNEEYAEQIARHMANCYSFEEVRLASCSIQSLREKLERRDWTSRDADCVVMSPPHELTSIAARDSLPPSIGFEARATFPQQRAEELLQSLLGDPRLLDIPGLLSANTISSKTDGSWPYLSAFLGWLGGPWLGVSELPDERFGTSEWHSLAAYYHCPAVETAYEYAFGSFVDGGQPSSDLWQARVEMCMNPRCKYEFVCGLPQQSPSDAYHSAIRKAVLQVHMLGFQPAQLVAAQAAALEFHESVWSQVRKECRTDEVDLQSADPIPPDHPFRPFWEQQLGSGGRLSTYVDLKKYVEAERLRALMRAFPIEVQVEHHCTMCVRLPNSSELKEVEKHKARAVYELRDGTLIAVWGPMNYSTQGALNWATQWMMEALMQAGEILPSAETLQKMGLELEVFKHQVKGVLPSWCMRIGR